MKTRLEMLRVVNNMADGEMFDKVLVESSHEYFLHGDQMTILATDGAKRLDVLRLATSV